MFNTMYPKKFWHSPSWADHVAQVGFKADFFKAPDVVKWLENAVPKWGRGIIVEAAPGLTFT